MLSTIVSLAFGTTLARALAIRGGGCSVHFTVAGGVSGPVGEISSGQVRAGSGVDSTTFSFTDGGLTDPKGRGCWWTPPTHVLQCDTNQAPDNGFEIDCHGNVSYKGQKTFYECETGEKGQYNVYLAPNKGVNCMEITLTADGCKPDCPPPPPPPKPQGCPTDLSGPYEFPHLIVPVDSSKPDTAPGTSYFGDISGSVSSIFNFDIPSSDEGKKCSLVFLFPEQKDLETSSFTISGSGDLDFSSLKDTASESTTWNNKPGKKNDYGTTRVAPGSSYLIATFDCPAGTAIAFEIDSVGGTCLNYFQDYNPSPIGLYITKC
ncbi:Fc.00g004390.m01.CDS01 [Cosmosporella sp. VM-42]